MQTNKSVILLALLATADATAPVATAAPKRGTFAGTLGVKAAAGSVAMVRAVSLADRSVVAGRLLPRSGAFKLSLPAGSYLVVGNVLSETKTVTKPIAVTLRPGQRRTKAKLTAKPRRAKAGSLARSAYKAQGGAGRTGVSAVGINPFKGPAEGDMHYLAEGAASLVTVDLVNEVAKRCPTKVIVHEVDPAIVKALNAEAALGRSPYADRSSFPPERRIISDVRVDGTIAGEGAGASSTLTVKDARTGEVIATLNTTLGDDPFDALSKQTSELTSILCDRVGGYDVKLTLNATMTSPFDYTAAGQFNGTLIAEPATPGHWDGSGDFQWTNVTFTPSNACTIFNPVAPKVKWSINISAQGADRISVYWSAGGYDAVTATRDCPPDRPDSYDPPPDTRTPGVNIGSPQPLSFTLPKAGGTQSISGTSYDGSLTGTLTIRKVKTP